MSLESRICPYCQQGRLEASKTDYHVSGIKMTHRKCNNCGAGYRTFQIDVLYKSPSGEVDQKAAKFIAASRQGGIIRIEHETKLPERTLTVDAVPVVSGRGRSSEED